MSRKKEKRLPSLRNQDWGRVSTETEKKKKKKPNTYKNTSQNSTNLSMQGAKLTCIKISVPLKDTNGNPQPGWKIRPEAQIRNL